jgi:maltose alpha-D-glucosyltransferase / alpha-amylase
MALNDDPLWYKDAIIYEAHIKSFFDSNNDGVGDIGGLTSKLDYLQDLGITCLWLLPFYPSPLKDDGYDIADYRNVHVSYGTLEDFRELVNEAHARGIRVLTELVVNHTSDQHPWFQAARRAPRGSREREFYVWSDTDQKFPETRIIVTDSEKSNWTYDPIAGQYYWHRFFSHQPDLNHNNPDVVEAVIDIMRFWLDLGVDALRLDAVPYLCVREGTNNENLAETHAALKRMRAELDAQYANRALLAEANQWPADVRPYFGEGDECHMAFHFPLMPRMFMAVRQEDRHPITDIMRQTPEIPPNCQWALFLRNHDELTLEMVTDEERDYMYQAYAEDPLMRLNVGIRRRLAPLMENSRRRVELLTVLLFTLPGTPILYYGDEIGMGDNIYLGDRNGVRTPMQWSGDRNAGFSRADPARLYAPPIMDPVYGYQSINVEAQQRYTFSMLNWMKRMIALRKHHPVFGRGGLDFVPCTNRKVLAFLRRDERESLLVVANLSRYPQPTAIDLSLVAGLVPVEAFGETEFPRIGGSEYPLTLGPYGTLVFRLQEAVAPITARPVTPEPAADVVETPALLAGVSWDTLLDGALRRYIERDVLAGFLRRQRWATSLVPDIARVHFAEWGTVRAGSHPVFLSVIEAATRDQSTERYLLPLATASGPDAAKVAHATPAAMVARITGARKGILVDGAWEDRACELLLDTIVHERDVPVQHGVIRGTRADTWLADMAEQLQPITRPGKDERHSTIHFGSRKSMRIIRCLQTGPSPEIETARYLASRGFQRIAPLAGWLEYQSKSGEPTTMAVLEGLVRNQGDAWNWLLEELRRYYEAAAATGQEPAAEVLAPWGMAWDNAAAPDEVKTLLGLPLSAATLLGRRTAELHIALAGEPGDAFAPEPLTRTAILEALEAFRAKVDRAWAALDATRDTLDERLRDRLDTLRESTTEIDRQAARLLNISAPGARIRVHGDLHLANVLWVEQDYFFVGFGDLSRSPAERRRKRSPLLDVASLVRSFGYAAAMGLVAIARQHPASAASLTAWAAAWGGWMGAGFLNGYRTTMTGTALVPDAPAPFAMLLQGFLIDRAFEELIQEARHRPEWLDIPLSALEQLVQRT